MVEEATTKLLVMLMAIAAGVIYFSGDGISKAARISQGNTNHSNDINSSLQ